MHTHQENDLDELGVHSVPSIAASEYNVSRQGFTNRLVQVYTSLHFTMPDVLLVSVQFEGITQVPWQQVKAKPDCPFPPQCSSRIVRWREGRIRARGRMSSVLRRRWLRGQKSTRYHLPSRSRTRTRIRCRKGGFRA